MASAAPCARPPRVHGVLGLGAHQRRRAQRRSRSRVGDGDVVALATDDHGLFRRAAGGRDPRSLHQGVATGARGPAIAELTITKSADGTFTGGVELDREQRAALLAGHLYIQLHSERGVAPDGAALWGWLLTNQRAATNRCAMR